MTDASRLDAFLAAQRMQDEFYGFSAGEIERMPFDQYARLREHAGLDHIDPFAAVYAAYEPPEVATTVSAPEAAQANADAPQGVSLADVDMQTYARLRGQLGVAGREYGVGIMSAQSGTADWVRAAQSRGIGRTSYGQQNVQDAARIDAGKYLARNEPVTGRTGYYR
jgi:hypothetical protein